MPVGAVEGGGTLWSGLNERLTGEGGDDLCVADSGGEIGSYPQDQGEDRGVEGMVGNDLIAANFRSANDVNIDETPVRCLQSGLGKTALAHK